MPSFQHCWPSTLRTSIQVFHHEPHLVASWVYCCQENNGRARTITLLARLPIYGWDRYFRVGLCCAIKKFLPLARPLGLYFTGLVSSTHRARGSSPRKETNENKRGSHSSVRGLFTLTLRKYSVAAKVTEKTDAGPDLLPLYAR